jgi:hypothetical protein
MVVVLRSAAVPDLLVAELIESTSFPDFREKTAPIGLQIDKYSKKAFPPNKRESPPAPLSSYDNLPE